MFRYSPYIGNNAMPYRANNMRRRAYQNEDDIYDGQNHTYRSSHSIWWAIARDATIALIIGVITSLIVRSITARIDRRDRIILEEQLAKIRCTGQQNSPVTGGGNNGS